MNDHRTMINNINSSMYGNAMQNVVSNHYSERGPIWSSWRDIALLLILAFVVIQIMYYCVYRVKLRPWDHLISCIYQRHTKRELNKAKEHQIPHRACKNIYPNIESFPDSYSTSPITTVEDQYAALNGKNIKK